MSNDSVPDGMVVLWTIECPEGDGLFIDDLLDTQEEAHAEVRRRGAPWRTQRIVVPYRNPPGDECACFTSEEGWRPCPMSLCERRDHDHTKEEHVR